jgi:hypothetical protein
MAKKPKPAPEPVVEQIDEEEASGRGPTPFHEAMATWLEETYGGEHSVETVALAQTKRKQFRQSDAYKELISERDAAKEARLAAKAAKAEAADDDEDDEPVAPKPKKGKKAKAAEVETTEAAPEVKAKAKGKKAKAAAEDTDADDAPVVKAGKKGRKAAF